MSLRLEEIRAGYHTVEVLHGVDLVVPDGRTVALLGANGAGKSTLLRVAAGLLASTAGRVWLEGRPVEHQPAFRRARTGLCLIPEGRAVFGQLTVAENIAVYADGSLSEDPVERVVTAFPVLGQFLGQPAGRLSGGQQQMLALSRALVSDPRVILIDEVSVGLAPVIVDEIFSIIEALQAQGRSLVLVEQYVDRALDAADYVYVLHKGRIVFVGEPEQCRDAGIFERYQGESALVGQGARSPSKED